MIGNRLRMRHNFARHSIDFFCRSASISTESPRSIAGQLGGMPAIYSGVALTWLENVMINTVRALRGWRNIEVE
jgi:hypothetical protein